MRGRLPFFMFFMTKKLNAQIGMDYDRGLSMLKNYVEIGAVRSRILINGITPILPQQYVGLKNECHINELDDVRIRDLGRLQNLCEKEGWPTKQTPFSIHHRMNIETGIIRLVSAIPVRNKIKVMAPFITGRIKGSSALKVTHVGHYEHLGNAWSTAMNVARYQKLHTKKEILRIERYLNDPAETHAQELVTEILIPLRK